MYKVIPTSDDGYILAGFTWSFGSSGNGYLIKITLDEPQPEPEPEAEPEPETEPDQEEPSGGIPGFSLFSVSIGLIASSFVLFYKRQ
jgi:hypothetical protein